MRSLADQAQVAGQSFNPAGVTQAQWVGYLADAMSELVMEFGGAYSRVVEYTLTVGKALYNLPTDFRQLLPFGIQYIASGQGGALALAAPNWVMAQSGWDVNQGNPSAYYFPAAGVLGLFPVPSVANKLDVLYDAQFPQVIPDYDTAFPYNTGSYCAVSGAAYRSKVSANIGHAPASSATYWAASPTAFNSGTTYAAGDYCIDTTGLQYRRLSAGATYVPTNATYWVQEWWIETNYILSTWTLPFSVALEPGIRARARWLATSDFEPDLLSTQNAIAWESQWNRCRELWADGLAVASQQGYFLGA